MVPNKRGNNQHLRSLSALANPEATAKLNGLQVLKSIGSDIQVLSLFALDYFESNRRRISWLPLGGLTVGVADSRVKLVRSIARYAHLMIFVER